MTIGIFPPLNNLYLETDEFCPSCPDPTFNQFHSFTRMQNRLVPLQNDTAPTTRDLSSAFPPCLVLLWEHYSWWVSWVRKKRRGRKSVCGMVSNFRPEGSYIFNTLLLRKLITEKMLNER